MKIGFTSYELETLRDWGKDVQVIAGKPQFVQDELHKAAVSGYKVIHFEQWSEPEGKCFTAVVEGDFE